MIERIVLFKLDAEHATDEARRAIAAHSKDVMRRVTGVQSVSVGLPADEASLRSWDLALVVRLASMDDLPAYAADPLHREYVDEYMAPKVAVRKAWNFEVG